MNAKGCADQSPSVVIPDLIRDLSPPEIPGRSAG